MVLEDEFVVKAHEMEGSSSSVCVSATEDCTETENMNNTSCELSDNVTEKGMLANDASLVVDEILSSDDVDLILKMKEDLVVDDIISSATESDVDLILKMKEEGLDAIKVKEEGLDATKVTKVHEEGLDSTKVKEEPQDVQQGDQQTIQMSPGRRALQYRRPEEMLTEEMMPEPLPTAALRRNSTRRASLPGAQHVSGVYSLGARFLTTLPFQGRVEQARTEDEGPVFGDGVLVTVEGMETEADVIRVGEQATGDEEVPVIVGEKLPEGPNHRDRATPSKWSWPVLLLVVAVLCAVVVCVAVFLGRDEGGESRASSRHQTEEETGPIVYPPFDESLPVIARKHLEDPDNAIYKGNKWMLLDPNLHTYSQTRKHQRYILATLYFSTNGDNWTRNDNWLSYDVSECDWYYNTVVEELKGQPICDQDNNMLMLNMASNNLQGALFDMKQFNSVPFITHLWAIDFANNNISGFTPNLYEGVELEVISLSNNSFNAISPAQAAVGQSVRILKVDSNQIQMQATGLAWLAFPNVEIYNITGNQMSGILSPYIKNAKNLTYLGAGHTLLHNIPSEIGLLTNLVEIDLSGSVNMEGTLPTELGLLPNLRKIDVTDSMITGELPYQWCLPKVDGAEGVAVEVLANCSMVHCCQ